MQRVKVTGKKRGKDEEDVENNEIDKQLVIRKKVKFDDFGNAVETIETGVATVLKEPKLRLVSDNTQPGDNKKAVPKKQQNNNNNTKQNIKNNQTAKTSTQKKKKDAKKK